MNNSFEQLKEELAVVQNECTSIVMAKDKFSKQAKKFLLKKKKAEGSESAGVIKKGYAIVTSKYWMVAMPALLKLFASDVASSPELQQIAALWKRLQKTTQTSCFKRRDEILKTLHSLKPLDLKSPFVTLLLCIHRTGLSKLLRDIMPKIYTCYIEAEMDGFGLKGCRALERVSKGEKWLIEGNETRRIEYLYCLGSHMCSGQTDLVDCFSKSLYFEWLDDHFVKAHGCSWNHHVQNVFDCDHEDHDVIFYAFDKADSYCKCKNCGLFF